jgi:hypothetical protein
VRISIPLLRELTMLGLGSAGMARELFWVPVKDMSMARVTVCMLLMMGPALVWVWWRARLPANTPSGSDSPSSASRLPLDG